MQIHELTALARQMKASDIHLSEGLPLMFRVDGRLMQPPVQMSADETRSLILGLMDEAHREAILTERIDADFALVAPDGTRSRVNVFFQQGRAAATLRLLNDAIPTLAELSMPPVLTKLADEPRGLILVTGPTGSGKSTTLAAMIDHINETRSDHIITIEDPIEYVYQGRQALIHQREVGADARSFASALRSALREDPDVILVGEMRDYETISAAVTAAETGHLVLSTLHTIGAARPSTASLMSAPPVRRTRSAASWPPCCAASSPSSFCRWPGARAAAPRLRSWSAPMPWQTLSVRASATRSQASCSPAPRWACTA